MVKWRHSLRLQPAFQETKNSSNQHVNVHSTTHVQQASSRIQFRILLCQFPVVMLASQYHMLLPNWCSL
jgi:hypothetical protein